VLWNFFILFINSIIFGLGSILNLLVSVLPNSPFILIDNSVISDYIGKLNWLIPVSSILAILQLWLVAVAVFYVNMIVLRWVKAIE